MKTFVGLLSDEDAELLERYAMEASRILEFGMGGSTHIFAQCLRAGSRLDSVETDRRWIERTRADLAHLGFASDPRIHLTTLETFQGQPRTARFDLVFIDGAAGHRRPFAYDVWSRLEPGGVMLFHDTRNLRVPRDLDTALQLARDKLYEVDELRLNEKWHGRVSNTTAIRKKAPEPWIDWTKRTDRPQWRFGRGDVPSDFWRSKR